MRSYDYSRRTGIHEIDWDGFDSLCDTLAVELAVHRPEVVIGIARGGLLPATTVAARLRLDLTPVRLTRREGDRVVRREPEWKMDVPPDVAGRSVAIIDEMADSGQTLDLARRRVVERGAKRVVSGALVAHSWAEPLPDAVALMTDALVVFPWDRKVLREGRWITHPELAAALESQGRYPI